MPVNLDQTMLAKIAAIRASGLFSDAEYEFRSEAAHAQMDFVHHYLTSGEARGGKPSRRFDPRYYREKYGEGDHSPLLHYMTLGKKSGNRALPFAAAFQFTLRGWRKGYPRAVLLAPEPSDVEGNALASRLLEHLTSSNDVAIAFLEGKPTPLIKSPRLAGVVCPSVDLPMAWEGDVLEARYLVTRIIDTWQVDAAICCGMRGRLLVPPFSNKFVPTVTLVYDEEMPPERFWGRLFRYSAVSVFASDAIRDAHETRNPWLASRRTRVAPLLSDFETDIRISADAVQLSLGNARAICTGALDTFKLLRRSEDRIRQQVSGLFHPEQFRRRLKENCIVTATSSGGLPSYPVPRMLTGFDAPRYTADRKLVGSTATLEYLAEGAPPAYRRPVIDPSSAGNTGDLKVALHGHYHHTDVADELFAALSVNKHQISLYLSTDTDAKREQLATLLQRRAMAAEIRVVPNQGRDLGSLLTGFPDLFEGGFDVVGHVHGKKSEHAAGGYGERWRRYLLEHTVGGRHATADAVISAFNRNDRLGLVFPEDDQLRGWDFNLPYARHLTERMNLPIPLDVPVFDFPAGSFFWCRASAIRPLISLKLDWDDYPREPVPNDGTILHAIERLLSPLCLHTGYEIATTFGIAGV